MTIKSDVFRFAMVFSISVEFICFVFIIVNGDITARVLSLLIPFVIYFMLTELKKDFNKYEVKDI